MTYQDEDISPDSLKKALDEEREAIAKDSKRSAYVKIPKKHTWLLRFLPVKLGQRKLFYARLARHWINKKAYYCPRNTSPEWGGNPEAHCPICDVVDAYAQGASESVKNVLWRATANASWLTYCLVVSREDDRGNVDNASSSDRWIPHEFWLPRTAFERLMLIVRRGLDKEKPRNYIDLRRGCNFLAYNPGPGGKGIEFTRDDISPIVDTDDQVKFDKIVNKIMSAVNDPKVTFLKKAELQDMADKLEEEIKIVSRRSGDDDGDDDGYRAQRRPVDDDEDAPTRRRRPSGVDVDEDVAPKRRTVDVDEDEDEDVAPKTIDVAPKRRTVDVDVDEDEDEDVALKTIDVSPKRRTVDADADDDVAPKRRTVDADADDDFEDADDDGDDSAKEPLPAMGRKISRPPAASVGRASASSVDEDEDIAEEDADLAPPAKASRDIEEDDEEAPPPVQASGSTKPRLNDRLARNIQSAKERSK
jgi:hypothetical protein